MDQKLKQYEQETLLKQVNECLPHLTQYDAERIRDVLLSAMLDRFRESEQN